MGLNYFASSPVLVLPQQPSNHFQHHHHNEIGGPNHAMAPNQSPPRKSPPKFPTVPSMSYLAQSSNGIAGRKRSRADVGDEHDDPVQIVAGPVQPLKSKVEPVLGPGMTLVYPDEPALNIGPESQSGTWMEEKSESTTTETSVARPRIIARKSQRRSVDEGAGDATSERPDPILLRLGVGWKRIPESQSTAIAGSERYIRNQYPYVKQPKILLQHEGLRVLVARSETPIDQRGLLHQWWLFTEDLNQCRLLCNSNEEEVFRRLSHKQQDDRGNWIPDILVDGQIIHAKDSVPPPAKAADSDAVMEVDQ